MNDDFLPIEITLDEKAKVVITPLTSNLANFSILYKGYQDEWLPHGGSLLNENLCLILANSLIETANKMKRLRGEVEKPKKQRKKAVKRVPTLIEQFGLVNERGEI